MRRIKKFAAAATTLLAATLGTAVAAQPANAVTDGYYRTAFDGGIYRVSGGGAGDRLTYTEWVQLGRPSTTPAPVSYDKYPWSSRIYAVISWQDSSSVPRTVVPLTLAEWRTVGSPPPTTELRVPGSHYQQWGTSPEIFVYNQDQEPHKLTYDQWVGSGSPSFTRLGDQGFIKLSWSPQIVFAARLGDLSDVEDVDFGTWVQQDRPTPLVQQRFPGDSFTTSADDPTITYHGPTFDGPITYAQWRAAGSPAPTVR